MKLLRMLGISANLLRCREDLRFAADELDVVYSSEARRKRARIKDISATGLYMLTEDRWTPGTGLPLAINKWRLQGENPQSALRLRACVVRHGNDGVGLEFSNRDGNATAWSCLTGMSNPASLKDALAMLRFVRAVGFLCRLSPSHEVENFRLIEDELAFESSDAAIETLLVAEELATCRGFEIRPQVSLDVIRRIVHEGSKTPEPWIRRFWGGLLAACVPQSGDEFKTLAHADLLSALDSVQVRIVAASCSRSGYKWDDAGVISPQPLACTAEELKQITRVRDLPQIEHRLDRLCQLGLLEKTVKADPFAPLCDANLTPTRAALALFAECNGWPEWSRSAELLTRIEPEHDAFEPEWLLESRAESEPVIS